MTADEQEGPPPAQDDRPEADRGEGDALEEAQRGKGYGEDEGERDDSLRDG